MKITATKRDDIIREREKYDKLTSLLEEKNTEQRSQYKAALAENRKAVEAKISEAIGSTFLDLSIDADPFGTWIQEESTDAEDVYAWRIRIKCNEDRRYRNESEVGLIWNWDVTLDENREVKKESGSWSGLNAVTAEQIADLEESVRVIKVLNNLDWKTILRSEKAKKGDFVDEDIAEEYRRRSKQRPHYEDQLRAAELEELVGGNTAIKLSDDQYWRGDVWILPTGLTDKFVKGYIFPDYYTRDSKTGEAITREALEQRVGEVRRTSRGKLMIRDGKDYITREIPE